MWPAPQETVDPVTFTEEILNGKLQFLFSVKKKGFMSYSLIQKPNSIAVKV